MSVRVRYAPSPTGLQHIGGLRTALFNYFFARSQGGTFILRIEDTDRERYDERALQDLFETFEWLGITWDEGPGKGGPYGPYFQSERKELYQEHARLLVEQGHAYRCFCTPERLEQLRKERGKGRATGYDRHCRKLPPDEVERLLAEGRPHVIRFKVPVEGSTVFEDYLLGRVEYPNADVNPDPVLLKSDGFPTYHLANVVDDHLMRITHILRAQEWIPSTPLHVLLYRAFGWEHPVYCHLPMVLGPDGQKLSKRHGATSVQEFRRMGYLPEAVVNYVSLLGWAYDDSRELFTREELERVFTLEKLNKSPAVFDYKKLEWFNGVYIRAKTDEELFALLLPVAEETGLLPSPPTDEEKEKLRLAVPIVKERLKVLRDVKDLLWFLFHEVPEYEPALLVPKKLDPPATMRILTALKEELSGYWTRTDEENEQRMRALAERMGIKLGQLLMPLRVAVTGSTVSPPLLESIRLLGAEETLQRIDRALEKLSSLTEGE
ncbi:glutamate--tRNA ligase [Spirochaeta thermophila]|uniref:Glutamate--tRNA ligase n=1 Tax=Winmispira thermophila (strain ATCC 49972 / DSM 6192 / RI 19.B1) TaxID=665571 RepID=E0RT83_WINT6|nr:glutamate--tRNA ligase [Spirochaeta thermophila]ADN02379.1 glutamyl-tRNA synthetase [Spirochaeta thermophila DSM 6192]